MGPKQAEIANEQAHFDRARECRERKRSDGAGYVSAGAHAAAAMALKRQADRERERLSEADEAVAVGRIDDESGETLYVGKHLIMGPDGEPMVIGWQTPAAEPYYRATHADPMSLRRKRTFECTANRIDDFSDVIFAAVAAAAAGHEDALLSELSRQRTGRMRDIVKTIQSEQFELVTASWEQLLVIEGGPGTGKTAVALHRVSALLYRHRERFQAEDVLVVGPNPTFSRYIGTVLPGLGDGAVAQMDIGQLAPQVRRGRRDPEAVARLKGDSRMAELLERALHARIGRAEPAERLQVAGRFVTLPGSEVDHAVALGEAASGPYAVRRLALRDRLWQMVVERGGAGPQSAVDPLVNRLWPQLSAAGFLRDLFNSRDRLLAAAGDEFTAAEALALRRRGADRLSEETWSRDDLPLLDEAAFLIDGLGKRYGHIVVDEAQDLSPMQLRSIARRSATGSLTVIGDLAQSTGAWARDGWHEVTRHLPAMLPTAVRSLRWGYRVPKQVCDFVAPLLTVAAPAVAVPEVVRIGPTDPLVHKVGADERAARVAAIAGARAEQRLFVGIVCPGAVRAEVEHALAANGLSWSSADRGELGSALNLVSPQEAKGLEFDAVIVVEPEQIVAADPRGHRLLYVAMTRTTGYLDVVCVGEPLPLNEVTPQPPKVDDVPAAGSDRLVDVAGLAHQIAVLMRANVDQSRFSDVLREVTRMLKNAP